MSDARSELENRPLVVLALGLILGLTLSRQPLNLFLLIPLPWLLQSYRSRVLVGLALFLGAIIGPAQPPRPMLVNEYVDTTWQVSTLPKLTAFGQRCEIEREGIRLTMTYDGPVRLCPGATVHVKGVAQPPVEGMEQYFASRNLVGRIQVSSASLNLIADGPWIQRLGRDWRDLFLDDVSKNLPPRPAAATSALCFNADGLLDSSTRAEMQHTGTTHIIAASGLQVIVIAQTLLWMLSRLPVPRWLQLAVVLMVLAAYSTACGLNPPVVRAGVMWAIANYAYVLKREPDWPSALAMSSILYLLWKPATIYDMGFQFSVVAVLFLALFGDHMRWRPGFEAWAYRGARQALRTSIVAFVVVTPLIAYHFGMVSIVSIPANLLVVFAVTPVVILAMLALPIGSIWPAMGSGILQSSLPFTNYIDAVLHSFGGETAAFQVPPFSAYWLVPFYIGLILLWRPYVRSA